MFHVSIFKAAPFWHKHFKKSKWSDWRISGLGQKQKKKKKTVQIKKWSELLNTESHRAQLSVERSLFLYINAICTLYNHTYIIVEL